MKTRSASSLLVAFSLGAIGLTSMCQSAFAQPLPQQDPDLTDYRRFISYPHLEKGLKAYGDGNYQLAVKELAQAYQLAPESRRIALHYARALEANGESKLALATLKEWVTQGKATPEMQAAYHQIWLSQSKEDLRKLRAASTEQEFQKTNQQIDTHFDSIYDESVYIETLAKSPYVTDKQLLAYTPQYAANLETLIVGRLQNKRTTEALDDYLRTIAPVLIGNPAIFDQVTYMLSARQHAESAASLLIQAYPYKDYPASTKDRLWGRLSAITVNSPQLVTATQTKQLCQPLNTNSERTLQIELLRNLNACDCLRENFLPYEPDLNARDWANISQCYLQQPGLAQYAAERGIAGTQKLNELKLLAYSAHKAEDYSTAITTWRKIPESQMSLADILAAQNTAIAAEDLDFARKMALAYQAASDTPSDRFYWNQAQLAIAANQWETAAYFLEECIKLKEDAIYFEKLGFVEEKLGRRNLSTKAYEKAAEIAPNDSQIQSSLGFNAYYNEDYPRAIQAFSEATKGRPDDITLTEQLAYAHQKLGINDKAIYFSKQAINDYQRRSPAELSERDINTEFGLRRMNEDLTRRWTFNIDGAISNHANPLTGNPQPGLSYRNFLQAEAAYRLGEMGVDNGKTYSAYSRMFSGNGINSNALPLNAPMLGVGLRWKPFSEQVINLAAEEQIPLDKVQGARTDTLLRASGSFFNTGRYSDEWHPTGSGWFAQNLYLDAAYYLKASTSILTADYRTSYHFKLSNAKTIEPYTHLQWNTMNNVTGDDVRIGAGIRWNFWRNEDKYNAYSSRYFLGIEAQHAFTTYLNAKNAILAVLGIRL